MHSQIALLLLILALIGCQTNESQPEDMLYACLTEHYDAHNINLAASLDSLEDYLIEQNILTSKDGQGKIEYYKEIIRNERVSSVPETGLFKRLRKAYIDQETLLQCVKSQPAYDSVSFANSTFLNKTKNVEQDAVSNGTTHVVLVSQAIIKHYSKEDFEHPFLRAHMLISFVMTNERDKSYIKDLPKEMQEPPSSDCFLIDISKPGYYSVNGQSTEKESIEKALLDYLANFNDTTCVVIFVGRKTIYSQFAEVQTFISNSYRSYWSKISMEKYNQSFDQLNSQQQEEIRANYPMRITEAIQQ